MHPNSCLQSIQPAVSIGWACFGWDGFVFSQPICCGYWWPHPVAINILMTLQFSVCFPSTPAPLPVPQKWCCVAPACPPTIQKILSRKLSTKRNTCTCVEKKKTKQNSTWIRDYSYIDFYKHTHIIAWRSVYLFPTLSIFLPEHNFQMRSKSFCSSLQSTKWRVKIILARCACRECFLMVPSYFYVLPYTLCNTYETIFLGRRSLVGDYVSV